MNVISQIISDIGSINTMVARISESKKKQIESNRQVNQNANFVTQRSDEISAASNEQKNAIEEISRSINNINQLAQENAEKITSIAAASKDLVKKIHNINTEIEKYISRG